SSVLRTVGAALDDPHRGPEVDALRGPVEPGRSDGATLRDLARGGQGRAAGGARTHRVGGRGAAGRGRSRAAAPRPLRRADAVGAETSAHTVAGCVLPSPVAVPSAAGSPSPEAALSPTACSASSTCSAWIAWKEVRRAAS